MTAYANGREIIGKQSRLTHFPPNKPGDVPTHDRRGDCLGVRRAMAPTYIISSGRRASSITK